MYILARIKIPDFSGMTGWGNPIDPFYTIGSRRYSHAIAGNVFVLHAKTGGAW